ncbi:hypothetical protein [Methanobrevibacter sp. TMH8]|nr:hypothetical protein [Methanobrevibacter sp. TMH8]
MNSHCVTVNVPLLYIAPPSVAFPLIMVIFISVSVPLLWISNILPLF